MTNILYAVVTSTEVAARDTNCRLLQAAAKKKGIRFELLVVPVSAYAMNEVPTLQAGGIYRVSSGARSAQYLLALQLKNPGLKYWEYGSRRALGVGVAWRHTMYAEHEGLPVLPTLYGLTGIIDTDVLDNIESELGGFPVIVKVTGGAHGRGVMIADTPFGLKSVVGHILAQNRSADYVLRKFIPNAKHYRVIVVDRSIVSVIEYLLPKNDFRTNSTKQPDVVALSTVPKDVRNAALQCTEASGLAFGGVDVLVDKEDQVYVAEINTPCNFSRNQLCTGDPIAERLIEYLCGATNE